MLLVLAGGCSEANRDAYAQAAVGTGAAVTMVGVNRAVTHDCWARCSPGYLCNEKTGLCDPGECLPGCSVGMHCARDVRGVALCVRDPVGAPSASPSVEPPGTPPPPPS